MRRYPGVLLAFLFVASAVLLQPNPAGGQAPPAAATEPLRTAGDRPIDIQHIRLDLKVDLAKKTVDARATLKLRSLRRIGEIRLDAVDFEVKQVKFESDTDRQVVPFSHDGKKLVVELGAPWPAGKDATLVIDYRVREPKAGLHFFGPTAAEPDVPLTVWSQGESTLNRYWIPCLDQPNQRQTTEMVVIVPEGFEAVSNGRLVERRPGPVDHTVMFHWLQDKPHVSYLITLVVGRFDVVREDWEGLPVLYYAPKGRQADVARSFGRTREMLSFFSRRFGVRYPWDQYAQVVAEQYGGGMENTSATTLTDFALHDERSMLDSSPDWLIAHELAHQWWGDLVTCRDWAHLWLNEGFASYAEALWAEHAKGKDDYAHNMFEKSRGALGQSRPVVDRRYPNPDSMFDGRSYPKGAWLLHMLRHRLGEDAFWKCIQRYGDEHRLRCAETADFRKTLERETGRDLERFFYDWTERPGNPVLEVAIEYLPETKQARVVVKQTQAADAFHFPLQLSFRCPQSLRDKSGSSQPVEFEEEVTAKEHTFYVPLPGRPTLAEVDPAHVVLAELKEEKGSDLWRTQLRESGHVMSRIRAAQHFGKSKTPADREALAQALEAEKFWGVQAEIAAALGESGGDTCRDALLKGLRHSEPKTRRACVEQLAKFPRDDRVAAALKALLAKGDPAYSVESAALQTYAKLRQPDALVVLKPWLTRPSHREILRTAALHGLGETQDLAALDTLVAWTVRGKPRECRSAALQALGRLARSANPSDEQRRRIFTAIAACLEGEGQRVRMSALGAVRDLGQGATPALATLDVLALHDPDGRVRDLAKQAAEKIRSNAPAPAEVTRLREELDRLRKEQTELRDRLERFEKRGSKATAELVK